MSKWIITVLVALLIIAGQFAYNCWQDEKKANKELSRLEQISKDKEAEIERQYKIALDAQTQKEKAENESIKFQDELKDVLQNNNCANELIPSDISNKLRKRADSLR